MTEARDKAQTPLFRRHARRPRLTALLDEATAQSILLTAPAGYGKTTLAREWLQGREDVAWYRATSASADVGAFSAGLAEAVAPLVPDAGERVRQRLRVGDATERLARPLAELLSEDLETFPEGGVVVLDDYHLLAESAPVEDFLDWLLTLTPIRVLVTSRRRPGWATARRFLYGEAVEIGGDQLAMTDEEAARVLEGRSTEAVRALVRQAEGWPAVIGLAALSADLAFPEEHVSDSLYRYFAEEVLRAEPPEVQRFMLAASVPNSIDVRLAAGVLHFDDPEPILLALRDEALLHEIPSGELVFHPLIRDFLRRRFDIDDRAGAEELTRLVIADATEHARWSEAFELSAQAGWIPEAAEIVGLAARTLLSLGQNETLEKWLDVCGGAAVTVTGAALARAELLIRKGEMSSAAALAEDTVGRLDDAHPDFAWASNVAGRALHFMSQEKAAFERFESARTAARTHPDLKECLWGLVLTAAEISPEKLNDHLSEFAATYPDDIDVRLRLAVGHALAGEIASDLTGSWERFLTLLPAVRHSQDPLAASTFLAGAASVAVLGANYSAGRDISEQALRLCTDLRVDFAIGACHVYRAAAQIGQRLFAQASRSLRSYWQGSNWRDDPYFQVEALVQRARLLASQGALPEAIATREDLPDCESSARPLGSYLGTLSMILAADGQTAEARRTAELARVQGRGVESMFCSSLAEAISYGAEGRRECFASHAAALVIRCDAAQYLDGVVFAYRLWPDLLEVLSEDQRALRVVRMALAQSRDFDLAKRAGIACGHDTLDEPLTVLTPREQEVLGLLLEGMTNGQIASRLFITEATVKVHVRHILRKLGAKTRLQAVIRAQELAGPSDS